MIVRDCTSNPEDLYVDSETWRNWKDVKKKGTRYFSTRQVAIIISLLLIIIIIKNNHLIINLK